MRILVILIIAAAVFGGAGYSTWLLFIKPQEDLRLEKLLPPPPPPPDPTVPDFNRIVELQKQGNLPDAKAGFADFIERYPESTKQDEAKNRLGEINTTLFFARGPGIDREIYTVKSGDVISRVAAKTKASPELIMRVNNLNTINLRIGQTLVIPNVDFSVVIYRQQKKVALFNKGKFFKQYVIHSEPAAAAPKKGAAPTPAKLPKISAKVTEKIAWSNGNRVTYSDTGKGYESADHWIVIHPGGNSLYTDREPGPNEPKPQKPPGGGYGLAADAMRELAALVNKNASVTIE